jgi:hypothetical protein
MQILHPFAGSVTQYAEEISDPDRYGTDHCPQCGAKQPLTGHGFYCRTLVDLAFDGVIHGAEAARPQLLDWPRNGPRVSATSRSCQSDMAAG